MRRLTLKQLRHFIEGWDGLNAGEQELLLEKLCKEEAQNLRYASNEISRILEKR